MCCQEPGRPVQSSKFCRLSSGPCPAYAGSSSLSGCRMPNPYDVALSFWYQLYPRLYEISRVQKKLCGGGNAAIEPDAVSTATRRLADCRAAGALLTAASKP